ncbi:MAG: LysR family transcriptional regulator, partial [Rhizobiales bacterium]|nr:LysR family transcriptional regulator [Rhizobacter sp.]
EERYFLVTLAAHLAHPHVASLLGALQSAAWRSALDAIPGHAAERCGEVLALSQVLPWWNYRKPKASRSAAA